VAPSTPTPPPFSSATMAKTALVTGGSRGIGRATCLRLARDGYEVVAVARDAAGLKALSAEIVSAGGACRTIVLDLTEASRIAGALAGLVVDVLVNNAGIGMLKPFIDTTPDEWHRMVDLNVNALYHVTRSVLPAMLERGGGHICTVGSIAGRGAFAGGTCYAATKAFVTSWSESLMLEVRERGVKVSVVMPGSVATEFNGNVLSGADAWKLSAEDVAEAVAHVVDTPRNVLVHRLEVRTLKSPPAKRHGS
jgi:short-subunit dehydrogenase